MEKVIVFGCGSYYKKKKAQFCSKYKIIAFLDNNADQKRDYEGIPIYPPSQIDLLPEFSICIMTSIFYCMDIFHQLLLLGVSMDRILFGANERPAINELEEMLNIGNGCIVSQNGEMAIKIHEKTFSFSDKAELKNVMRYLRRLVNPHAESLISLPIRQGGAGFGGEYGTPIDRYYIEKFLKENSQYICGDILEVAENTYTYRFGHDIRNSYKLHVNGDDNCIKGNLETGAGIEENMADCFICTQTLQFIYDIHSVVRNIYKLLRPGGVALITAHGISQIAMYSYRNWGEYWRFTEQSMRLLMEEVFRRDKITVHRYGNVKTAMCFLYGLCQEDLKPMDFAEDDEMFQLVLGAACVK